MEQYFPMDYFTEEGRWWLPSTPDRKLWGKMTFDADGISLEIDGCFWTEAVTTSTAGAIEFGFPQRRTAEVVHGRTRTGTSFTLFDVQGMASLHPDLEAASTLTVEGALRGGTVTQDSFEEVWFDLDQLEAWWDPPPIVDLGDDKHTVTVAVSEVELTSISLASATLRVVAGVAGTSGQGRVDLQRWVSVCVVVVEPQVMATLAGDYARPMQELLMFCLEEPVRIMDVRVSFVDLVTERQTSGEFFFKKVEAKARPLTRSSLLNYTSNCVYAVGDHLIPPETLIRRWFEMWPKLKTAVSMLNAQSSAPFMFQESSFLFAFQAAESASMMLHGTKELPDDEHARRVDEISRALESDGVGAANRERAMRLFSRNDKPLKIGVDEMATYVGLTHALNGTTLGKLAAGLRGKVAHPGAGSPNYVLRHWAAELLRWVVRIRILMLLVENDDAVRSKMKTRHALQQTIERINGELIQHPDQT